ncbi:chemokine-like receptor 1 [Chanos chanos]|uniref:Chemokine-like receptor 1 n=1 Tax=Chanos chanos TaxID=29144 RepID=A0A6J2WSV0_CHACN|nr:chemokine-like receptor 1 [Chanos chanos]
MSSAENVTVAFDYDAYIREEEVKDMPDFKDYTRIMYIAAYSVVCFLGSALNLFVFCRCMYAHCKQKKSNVLVWIFSLAVSHLVFCLFTPLQLHSAIHHFVWKSGTFFCKFSSFIIYTNMFSTGLILTLWTVHDLLPSCRQRNLCKSCDVFMVLGAFTMGALLAMPSLLSREIKDKAMGEQCLDDYRFGEAEETQYGRDRTLAVVCVRFFAGLALPAFVMGIACCVRREPRNKGQSKIICCMKVAYLVLWGPLISLTMLQAVTGQSHSFSQLIPGATAVAALHSCVNPIICILAGKDFKMNWMQQSDSREIP